MTDKPTEAQIIDYLYGQAGPDTARTIERQARQDSAFAAELNELRMTLGLIRRHRTTPPKQVAGKSAATWRWPLGVAASLLFLLLGGWLSSFHLHIKNGELYLGFGSLPPTATPTDTIALQTYFNNQLAAAQAQWLDSLRATKRALSHQWNERLHTALAARPATNEALLEHYISALTASNREMMSTYLAVNRQQQEAYLQEVLFDFRNYLEAQRIRDLKALKASLLELQISTEEKQAQTKMMITDLLNTVNQNTPGQ